MKRLLTFFVIVILFGCGQTEKKSEGQWKTIEVGDYLFDFPSDFELVTEKGIDSYVGKLKVTVLSLVSTLAIIPMTLNKLHKNI